MKYIFIPISLLVLMISFYLYTLNIYKADENAHRILKTNQRIEKKDDDMFLLPSSKESDIGIIFYPGGKVEYLAYLPLLNSLSEYNINCVLVKMPFNLAILNSNKANKVIEAFPNIKHWYIMGHSLGGVMASKYAHDNPNKVKGLILLGAYLYKDFPLEKTLTIYGSLNTSVEKKIKYSQNVVRIEGGNHAQFGNYGKQKNDKDAIISWELQQSISCKEIVKFIFGKEELKKR